MTKIAKNRFNQIEKLVSKTMGVNVASRYTTKKHPDYVCIRYYRRAKHRENFTKGGWWAPRGEDRDKITFVLFTQGVGDVIVECPTRAIDGMNVYIPKYYKEMETIDYG